MIDVFQLKKIEKLSDTGNGIKFAKTYRKSIRYIFKEKKYIIQNGKYWEDDVEEKSGLLAEQLIRQILV